MQVSFELSIFSTRFISYILLDCAKNNGNPGHHKRKIIADKKLLTNTNDNAPPINPISEDKATQKVFSLFLLIINKIVEIIQTVYIICSMIIEIFVK